MHTEAENGRKHPPASGTEYQRTDIVDTVDLTVAQLELANHPVRPRRNATNCHQTDDPGNDAEGVKGRRNSEQTQTDLGLHHQDDRIHKFDLARMSGR